MYGKTMDNFRRCVVVEFFSEKIAWQYHPDSAFRLYLPLLLVGGAYLDKSPGYRSLAFHGA